jgi:nucleotide-binding universal stress UspA family protein
MSWGDDRLWHAARAERPLDELTNRLPCDFLVVKNGRVDASRVLLPTAGGPYSDLSAEVARTLQSTVDAEVSVLHVVESGEREAGEAFLADWTTERGLGDARRIVDDSGDIEAAIERAAADHTLVLLGATERGLLSRLVRESLHLDVVNDVDASMVLVERPSERSLSARLFGRGRREKQQQP